MDHESNFIDLHTHILPCMDDGSPDLETSVEMLKQLKQQGVHTVILTPHFYTDRENLKDFLNRRAMSIQLLHPMTEQLGMTVLPACELYFTDYIFNNENISPLCIPNGKYILTELPFSCPFSDSTFDRISRLMGTLNVIPILAHIERYPRLMKDENCLERLLHMGCLTQINLDSLTSGFSLRKKLLNLIREGLVHVVGTDCHNLISRSPRYHDGIQIIEKALGREYVETLMNQSLQIIQSR